MDLAEIVDATLPAPFQHFGREIVAHVYTEGANRLNKDELALLQSVFAEQQPSHDRLTVVRKELESAEGDHKTTLETEAAELNKQLDNIGMAIKTIPLMVKKFEMDGEELTWRGQQITRETIATMPVEFLLAAMGSAMEVWNDPTEGAISSSIAPPEGSAENSTESTSA